jgi:hypothetical protein
MLSFSSDRGVYDELQFVCVHSANTGIEVKGEILTTKTRRSSFLGRGSSVYRSFHIRVDDLDVGFSSGTLEYIVCVCLGRLQIPECPAGDSVTTWLVFGTELVQHESAESICRETTYAPARGCTLKYSFSLFSK